MSEFLSEHGGIRQFRLKADVLTYGLHAGQIVEDAGTRAGAYIYVTTNGSNVVPIESSILEEFE